MKPLNPKLSLLLRKLRVNEDQAYAANKANQRNPATIPMDRHGHPNGESPLSGFANFQIRLVRIHPNNGQPMREVQIKLTGEKEWPKETFILLEGNLATLSAFRLWCQQRGFIWKGSEKQLQLLISNLVSQ